MILRKVALMISLGLLPLAADAQPVGKVYRIGVLAPIAPSAAVAPTSAAPAAQWAAFWQGMREHGYVAGHNLVAEVRSAEGRLDRLPALAAELVRLSVDVIVAATCGAPLNAARQATRAIPIVVAACNEDLVATGVVASLARPGGNVTGMSKLTPELAAKRLELLKEAVPTLSRVAVLWDPAYSDFAADWKEIRAAARVLGVTLQSLEFRHPNDFDNAFAAMTREGADALITFSDASIFNHRRRIADLAAKRRLPAMYAFREVPDAGGLMSYGPDINEMFKHTARLVDKILKGAKPADLPMEQPTKLDLVINVKTAKALGLTIPQSVLMRAAQVIQ